MYPADSTTHEMSSFPIEGNIVDHTWPFIITKENGKPDHIAITLLSHIVYWYRPVYIHNADGSVSIGKKYKADLLQRSYLDIEKMLGLTKREAQEAFQRLEYLGIVERELRTMEVNGQKISNVMFIKLNNKELSFKRSEYLKKCICSYAKKDEGIRQKGQGYTPNVMTYTENTTEITQEISTNQQQGGAKEKSNLDKINSGLIYKNTKGESAQVSESDIFQYFLKLPYSTEEIQSAITQVRYSNDFIGNIYKYIEAICLRIHNSKSLNIKDLNKKEECSIPDTSNLPKVNLGEYIKKQVKDKNEAKQISRE